MSKPWMASDDEGEFDVDNLSTQRWLEGQAIGANDVATFLDRVATEEFGRRNDVDALKFRNLADRVRREILPKMEQRAKAHEEEYPHRRSHP